MTRAEIKSRLADNLHAVEARIAAACARAGRRREEVTLVAVTKYVDCEVAALLPELGVLDLGESRPQELWRKAAALPQEVRWHLVGHLQRNKVERTLPLVHLIHSVDSVRLFSAIWDGARRRGRRAAVLLEVHLSGEESKHGFMPDACREFVESFDWVHPDPNVMVCGFMTMAAFDVNPEVSRRTFAELRRIREELAGRFDRRIVPLDHLSMGMTNDFEVAIEEGATLVRIGSALFEGLPGVGE